MLLNSDSGPSPSAIGLRPHRDHHRAARAERCPARARGRARSRPRPCRPTHADDRAAQPRRLADEFEHEQALRPPVDLGRVAEMLDPALVHHRDAVAHHQRLVLVVGDEDRGDAEIAQQAAQLDLHGLAQLAVERAERLVEQQQRGLHDDRARDRDALLLSAGEAGDAAARRSPPCAPATSASATRARDLGLAACRCACRPKRDVLGHGQVREQRVVLEHHADVALVRGDPRQVAARRPRCCPVSGAQQAGDDAQQRGLAAAGRAEQRDELAAADREAELAQHRRAAEALRDARRHRQCPAPRRTRLARGARRGRARSSRGDFLLEALDPDRAVVGEVLPVEHDQVGELQAVRQHGLGVGRLGEEGLRDQRLRVGRRASR